jgi:ElaB/YqjD/DUF883 family membrane-anchored ribosome-binding protein
MPKELTPGIGDDLELKVADPANSGAIATETQQPDEDGEIAIRTESVGDKLRGGGEKLAGQAADKARGLVAQGLERASEALTNAGKMVGDTADGIDERVGAEYGDYARRAAEALGSAGESLAQKSPDELIDDTRDFVRKSPGVALAGAAVVGFVLARLIKSGLKAGKDDRA